MHSEALGNDDDVCTIMTSPQSLMRTNAYQWLRSVHYSISIVQCKISHSLAFLLFVRTRNTQRLGLFVLLGIETPASGHYRGSVTGVASSLMFFSSACSAVPVLAAPRAFEDSSVSIIPHLSLKSSPLSAVWLCNQ